MSVRRLTYISFVTVYTLGCVVIVSVPLFMTSIFLGSQFLLILSAVGEIVGGIAGFRLRHRLSAHITLIIAGAATTAAALLILPLSSTSLSVPIDGIFDDPQLQAMFAIGELHRAVAVVTGIAGFVAILGGILGWIALRIHRLPPE